MSHSLEALVDAIEELYHYRRQKTLHECSLAVRDAKRKLYAVQYVRSASLQREYTVELQRCRIKMVHLRKIIDAAEPEYGALFDDLLKDVEARMEVFRKRRKSLPPG